MPSLAKAYDSGPERLNGRDPRRATVGGALFVLGTLALVAAIAVVTDPGGAGETAANRLAGTLAGLAIPAILLGVVAVLPANRREQSGVLAGATLTIASVALFRYAYPTRWTRTGESLAFPTAMLYLLGGAVALWFVLSAVATFKLRNNPQGTVKLELTRQGETREVHVSRADYRRYKRAIDRGEDGAAIREELESLYEQ